MSIDHYSRKCAFDSSHSMWRRPQRRTGLITLALTSVFSPPVFAADNHNPPVEKAAPVVVQIPQEVQQALQEQGEIRVIIGLKVDFKPEGELANQEEITKQQTDIAQAQEEFLGWLKDKSSSPLAEKTFATIPYVGISVTKETLQLVLQHPLVKDINIDEIMSLSDPGNSMEVVQ